MGFDPAVLRAAIARQGALEAAGGLGLLELTEPTETAVAAVFAHTAVLAGKEHNAESLAEAGRFFGRLAHLIDAVEDVRPDLAAGAFNPLVATGTGPAEARRHCDDALHGLRLALADLELESPALVRALLGREVRRSVDRVFAGYPGGPPPGQYPQHSPYPQQGPYPPQGPYPQQPQQGRSRRPEATEAAGAAAMAAGAAEAAAGEVRAVGAPGMGLPASGRDSRFRASPAPWSA